jgi:hypothetical protein
MRSILLIVPVLLMGLAKWPLLMIGGLYFAGAAWLAFEFWRAPMVDEQGFIVTASTEKTKPAAAAGSEKVNPV